MCWIGNDLEMTVFMGSFVKEGGKCHDTPKKKVVFGQALVSTTSHLLVLVSINVCSDNKHPLFYAPPPPLENPGSTTALVGLNYASIILLFIYHYALQP